MRPRAHLRVAVLAVVVPVGVTRLQTWFLLALWLAAQVAAALAPVKPGALPIAGVAHLAGFALGALAGAWLRWRELA
ncbi:MAG: rhomboid family intramembrane serine protease [Actinobacteria bacterium]|nr:MAG: rhomboid family intramembrane serine protease [Actinomycetota bacterium]